MARSMDPINRPNDEHALTVGEERPFVEFEHGCLVLFVPADDQVLGVCVSNGTAAAAMLRTWGLQRGAGPKRREHAWPSTHFPEVELLQPGLLVALQVIMMASHHATSHANGKQPTSASPNACERDNPTGVSSRWCVQQTCTVKNGGKLNHLSSKLRASHPPQIKPRQPKM